MASIREFSRKYWYGSYIGIDNYDIAKENYEKTLPLKGKRLKHGVDVRPLTIRRRVWETWHKDGDAYGMAFVQSYFREILDSNTQKVIREECVHNVHPLLMFRPEGEIVFDPAWMNYYPTWDVLGALLPKGITYVRYGSKSYFKLDMPDGMEPMYMFNPGTKMAFIPYEHEGKRYFRVDCPISESKILIDRDKAKKVRAELKPFLDYCKYMVDLAPAPTKHSWQAEANAERWLEGIDWLVRNEGEDIGEKWFSAIEAFVLTFAKYAYDYKTQIHVVIPVDADDLRDRLKGRKLYEYTRPYRVEYVPIGKPFFNNGRTME